jgi:hypothetical protein
MNEKRKMKAVTGILRMNRAVAVRIESKVPEDKSLPNTVIYNASTRKKFKVNKVVQDAMTSTRLKWSVYAAVLCKDDRGSYYHQGCWLDFKEHYLFDKISVYVADTLKELAEEVVDSHYLTTGWIAVPWGQEFADDRVWDIFFDYYRK